MNMKSADNCTQLPGLPPVLSEAVPPSRAPHHPFVARANAATERVRSSWNGIPFLLDRSSRVFFSITSSDGRLPCGISSDCVHLVAGIVASRQTSGCSGAWGCRGAHCGRIHSVFGHEAPVIAPVILRRCPAAGVEVWSPIGSCATTRIYGCM